MQEDKLFETYGLTEEDFKVFAARKNLTSFAKYIDPNIVLTDFHLVYYVILDMFAHGLIKKLMITAPPQHGKSEGSSRKTPSFMLGLNPDCKIAIGCYAASVAQDFNRDCQRIIDSEQYRKVFPDTFLNRSNIVTLSNMYLRNTNVFECVGHRGGLRVVGRGGGLTSKTVDVMIMDDVYKDYEEGNSTAIRNKAWRWYTTVVRKRLHNMSQELIVFTRWSEDDLIGRIEKIEQVIDVTYWADLENIPEGAWIRINFQAIKESEPTELDPRPRGTALWNDRHNLNKLLAERKLDPMQFECLNQGNPGASVGRLYQPFKTWIEKKDWGTYLRSGNYTDVADEGNDFMFSACYDIYKSENQVFNEKTKRFEPLLFALITDMEMTSENTDITTVTVPAMINRNGTQKVWVESNAGGAQFEKAIKKKIKAMTEAFHQGGNKESRVITSAAFVNTHIIFPFGWETRFKPVFDHVTTFLRDFSANTHDDPEDGLTGIYEKEIADGNVHTYDRESRGIKRRN